MSIGFEKRKAYFDRIIASRRMAHAYIFSGPESIGKKEFALELCRNLNAKKEGEFDADVKIITPRLSEEGEIKTIPIEDIREVPVFLSLAPASGSWRVVVIDAAERLTIEAANALLKTLEEPLERRVFFLITSRPELLPTTIRSRCQEMRFPAHAVDTILQEASRAGCSVENAKFIAMTTAGRLGMALKLFRDPKTVSDLKKQLKDFQETAKQGLFQRLNYAKMVTESGRARELADLWLSWAYTRLTATPKAPNVIHALIGLNHELSQSQYNQRLALEKFFMNL